MPHFVGRDREVGWLEQRLAAAASGAPQTVVVDGPPGIGKSALLTAFASRLDPSRLLTASGDEDETSLPFGLMHQLVGALGEEWDDPFVAGADLLRLLDARSEAPTAFLVDDAHLADPGRCGPCRSRSGGCGPTPFSQCCACPTTRSPGCRRGWCGWRPPPTTTCTSTA